MAYTVEEALRALRALKPPTKLRPADVQTGERVMTPAMHLSAIKATFSHRADKDEIYFALEQAFSLGHSFGIERAASVVDQCNREGPYNAVGAASRIRALVVAEVKPVATIERELAP